MKRNKSNLALSKKNVGMPNIIRVPPLETSFESLESLIEIRRRYKNEKK